MLAPADWVLKCREQAGLESHRVARHDHAMLRPILIVMHQETSTPGRVGHALRQRGYPLDMRRPRFGDPLPETLAGHAGVVVFGGPMSANDPDDFVRHEIDWLGVPLKEKKPFLGICLGAQMLAQHLGAASTSIPDGQAEVGYYPIRPTDGRVATSARSGRSHVYQWHREGFDSAAGAPPARARATSSRVQAFRTAVPRPMRIQFHPEVTHAMMCRWTTAGTNGCTAGRQVAGRTFRRPAPSTIPRPRLARRFSQSLAGESRGRRKAGDGAPTLRGASKSPAQGFFA